MYSAATDLLDNFFNIQTVQRFFLFTYTLHREEELVFEKTLLKLFLAYYRR